MTESGARPVVPPGIQEFFLPAAANPVYEPYVLGAARVSFSDRKLDVHFTKDVFYLARISEGAIPVDWAESEPAALHPDDLSREPAAGAQFLPLPSPATEPRMYTGWTKSFARWLALHERLELLRQPALKMVSTPEESERDFRIRIQFELRAARDAAVDAVAAKYKAKRAALDERLRRAHAAVDREQQQASDQKLQTAVSFGATVLDVLLRRKPASAGSLGRATTAARGVGRTMREAADVKRAAESVESVRQAIAQLEDQIAADIAAVSARFEGEAPIEQLLIRPKRGQVEVQFVALAWGGGQEILSTSNSQLPTPKQSRSR